MYYEIGIDAGATRIKAVALGEDQRLIGDWIWPTADASVSQRVREQVEAIEGELGGPACAIGIATPGLTTPDGRALAHLPGRDMDTVGLDWTAWLGREQAVSVLNDAHAALVAEAMLGAAMGAGDVVMLTLGTGVGGAMLINRKLVRGRMGRAGHWGHVCLDPDGVPGICGMPGSLEDFVSNATVAKRTGGRFEDTRALIEAHLAGDAQASQAWRRTVWCLACGIGSIINAVDPELVVIGGGIAEAGDVLFDPLNEDLDRVEWRPGGARVRVERAKLGALAGTIGAARYAGSGCELCEERSGP